MLEDADASFLEYDDVLALLQPTRLLKLAARVRGELLGYLPTIANDIGTNADLATEPRDNFDDLRATLRALAELFDHDDGADALLTEAYDAIESEITDLERRKKEKEADEGDEEDDWDWGNFGVSIVPRRSPRVSTSTNRPKTFAPRSMFSDVDE